MGERHLGWKRTCELGALILLAGLAGCTQTNPDYRPFGCPQGGCAPVDAGALPDSGSPPGMDVGGGGADRQGGRDRVAPTEDVGQTTDPDLGVDPRPDVVVARDRPPQICQPGQPFCIDDTSPAVCDVSGTIPIPRDPCNPGQTCVDGQCEGTPDPTCAVDSDAFCADDRTISRCEGPGGAVIDTSTCPDGFHCIEGNGSAFCIQPVMQCNTTTFFCDGDRLLYCGQSGMNQVLIVDCASTLGTSCVESPDGACCGDFNGGGTTFCCDSASQSCQ